MKPEQSASARSSPSPSSRPQEPFSPEDMVCDSAATNGEVVEHTTSWLAINPFKGCSLGCGYCFRARWHPASEPQEFVDVDSAVHELLRHPEFIPHVTPVAVNISSTDALLPRVRHTTFRALELLEAEGLENPFGLTTKLELSASQVAFLRSLRHVRPIVFVSLAFLPESIEPVPVGPRIRTMRRLSDAGIPVVHYFRPIVPGWNDDPVLIERGLVLGDRLAGAICIGGLRLSPEIRTQLGPIAEDMPLASYPFHEKPLDPSIENRVMHAYGDLGLTVPLFKHTSCAVSYFIGRGNYNRLYTRPERNCTPTCPMMQQARCRADV